MAVRVRATATAVGGAWPPGAKVRINWGDRTITEGPAVQTHVYQEPRTYRIMAQALTRGEKKIGGPATTNFNAAAPTLSRVTPGFGPEDGGTQCILDGANLSAPVTAVVFGGNPATNIQLLGPTAISCTAPAGVGLVNVSAVAPTGTNPVQYEYRPAEE